MLLEEPETLDAELLQEEEAEAKAEAEGPARADHVHGWVTAGQWGDRIRGGMEQGPNLGGCQRPHGQQPGSLRR